MDQLLRKFILFALVFSQVPATAIPNEVSVRKLDIGTGWSNMGLRDRGISPLYYTGNQALITTRITGDRDSVINRAGISIMHGRISPALENADEPPSMITVNIAVSFSHLRKLSGLMKSAGRISLGGSVKSQFLFYEHNRMSNSSSNNLFVTTFNLKGKISYPVRIFRGSPEISFSAVLPLAAGIVRPSYSYIKPEGYLEHQDSNISKLLNSIEISTINRFAGTGMETAISYATGKGNNIIISYSWDYFEHSQVNRLQSAVHGIIIRYSFNY
jgi:hypothetical protein